MEKFQWGGREDFWLDGRQGGRKFGPNFQGVRKVNIPASCGIV
jgi:hypothetical protein